MIQSRFMALQIYRTRENRKFCKEKGIRISAPPVCWPPKNIDKEQKKLAKLDESNCHHIEGK